VQYPKCALTYGADGPCEAEFVSIRVKDMEIPLAPGSVSRREFGPQTSRHGLREKRIQVVNIEYCTAPQMLPGH
jgi:hypothetical protein